MVDLRLATGGTNGLEQVFIILYVRCVYAGALRGAEKFDLDLRRSQDGRNGNRLRARRWEGDTLGRVLSEDTTHCA